MLCFTLNLKLHVRTSFPEKHSNSSMQQSNVKSIVVASVHSVKILTLIIDFLIGWK